MKRILKEPLLHFLLLGAMLYVAYGILSGGGAGEPGRIVVTQGQIASLTAQFARARQRPPTDEELRGLIRGYVREEVLYREGLALGLDRDDPVIRRRIGQKLEFVAESGAPAEPGDKDLQVYLDSHREAFAAEPRFTFRQVYLDPRRHGATLAADAQRMLGMLNRPGSRHDATDLGDPTLLPPEFKDAALSDVGKVLGIEFAGAVGKLAPGLWQGPVKSAYGMHLVHVSERTEARTPALSEVREAVKREWERERRVESSEKFYQNLLRRYSVTIEGPQLAQGDADAGSKAR